MRSFSVLALLWLCQLPQVGHTQAAEYAFDVPRIDLLANTHCLEVLLSDETMQFRSPRLSPYISVKAFSRF